MAGFFLSGKNINKLSNFNQRNREQNRGFFRLSWQGEQYPWCQL